MVLAPGTRLGPYEITAHLGAGGMGEVYRATDTRLGRAVAIKVLPDRVAPDSDLRARFEREARTLASLSHPHICPIHDVGSQDDVDFLVMAYLEGETLAERLQRGTLPLSEALTHAIEIADALDKAHRQGIVHRDLKPGNVMLTRSGAMLMDFGLAKLHAGASNVAASAAQTATSPLTGPGSLVGTFQYMAPEQLDGREADTRSDIFAFGATLYEMVTGKRAFDGRTQATVIGAIMSSDPAPLSTLHAMAPAALDFVVRTCLAKNPDQRWQSAGDVGRQLRGILEAGSSSSAVTAAPPVAPSRRRVPWLVAAGATVVALLLGGVLLTRFGSTPAGRGEPVRFTVATASPLDRFSLAVSPDGRHVAFVAGSERSIFVRRVDAIEAEGLPGTEGATYMPFWSPDSEHVGFAASGVLKRIAIAGGQPRDVSEVGGVFVGGTWNARDQILFAAGAMGLKLVAASGGEPVVVLPGGVAPWFLPGGQRFLFTGADGVYVGSLDSAEEVQVLVEPGRAMYAPSGHLVFNRQDTLLAQPFDPDGLALTGAPVSVASGVAVGSPFPLGGFSVSSALAYVSGTGNALPTRLTWYDRQGSSLGSVGEPGPYRGIALSPDGRFVALHRHQDPAGGDVWVLDQDRGTMTRFTFGSSHNVNPVWSPDGGTIAFASDREGDPAVYLKPSSGAGDAQQVPGGTGFGGPDDWSPDGETLLFRVLGNILRLPRAGAVTPAPFVGEPGDEFAQLFARFSPSGRFVAYASNESGSFEVYVQPYPEPTGKWQISTEGGNYPLWAPGRNELYYLTDDGTIMAVDVDTTGGSFSAGTPHALFTARIMFGNHFRILERLDMPYAVSADGGRFLINERVDDTPDILSAAGIPSMTVVVDWDAALAP